LKEYEFEAELGLPEHLPANETLLWQGSPDWKIVARDVLHLNKLLLYFGLLLAWVVVSSLWQGQDVLATVWRVLIITPIPALALGLVAIGAWLIARTSVYTLTNRRVVMRIGIVLSVTFNLPLRQIHAVSVRANQDGSGDILLQLAATDQIAYLHMWPHVRPWRLRRAEPMLRSIAHAQQVAEQVCAALASSGIRENPVMIDQVNATARRPDLSSPNQPAAA
jgi:Bacterial PH domain